MAHPAWRGEVKCLVPGSSAGIGVAWLRIALPPICAGYKGARVWVGVVCDSNSIPLDCQEISLYRMGI